MNAKRAAPPAVHEGRGDTMRMANSYGKEQWAR